MFNGVFTALITPFDKNFNVDFEALEKLLLLQENSQVSGVVVLGTTAEECTLTNAECEKIVTLASKILKNKKLIVGVSGNNTVGVLEKITRYNRFDFDGYLIGCPYYNKPTQDGLYLHFKQIAQSTTKPIMLYNIPSRCAVEVGFNCLDKLSKIDNIVAIKEASGNIDYFTKLIAKFGNRFDVLCGNDNMFLPMLSCGATGCVSVVSNFAPSIPVDIYKNFSQNIAKSTCLHNKYLPVCNAMFVETNPAPIKYVLSKYRLCNNILRSPLIDISNKSKKVLNNLIKTLHFNNGNFKDDLK